MLIYKDIFCGDEMLSDIYKLEELHGGVVYKVQAKMMTVHCDIDESAIGGNKSAEGGDDEGVDSTKKTVLNLVEAHKLVEFEYEKKDYKSYIKEYMKKLIGRLEEKQMTEDEMKSIKKNLQGFVKEVLDNFKEYQFFVGESSDYEAMTILLRWEEGETVPFFYYFRHGLEEEKV